MKVSNKQRGRDAAPQRKGSEGGRSRSSEGEEGLRGRERQGSEGEAGLRGRIY